MVPLPDASPAAIRLVPPAACIAALLWLGGCTIGGSSTVSAQNDELRRKVADQQRQIESLAAARDELAAKLESASRGVGANPEVAAATPAVSVLEIDSLSTLLPLTANGPATAFRVHVRTLDGRRRFTQAVGALTVELKDGTGATLATGRVGPAALRDAYRSSVTGTHYTIDTPLPSPADGKAFTLTVIFEDALTGRRLEASKELTR